MSFIIKKVEADDDTVKHADGWHGVILKNILAPSVEKNNVPVGVLTDMLAKYAALSLADGKTVCEPQSTGPLPRPIGWLSSWKRVASPFIWKRVASPFIIQDAPQTTPADWANGVAHHGLPLPAKKEQIARRIDADVIQWFRAQGSGWQTRMNAVLKAYSQAVGPQNG